MQPNRPIITEDASNSLLTQLVNSTPVRWLGRNIDTIVLVGAVGGGWATGRLDALTACITLVAGRVVREYLAAPTKQEAVENLTIEPVPQEREPCSCDYGPIIPPPMDGDYVVSFDISNDQELNMAPIREFFQKYGFVVLRNAAPEEVIDQCERELMETAGLTQDDLDDLESVDWLHQVYGSEYNMGKGFVSNRPAVGPGSIRARQQNNILAIYADLLGEECLYSSMDRFGLMRPTKSNPSWATETGFVHWDQNPTHEPEFERIQGILTLSDHTATSGGFHCIPGSHLWFKSYGEKVINLPGKLVPVKAQCAVKNHLFRIPARRGSLIIWDSRTAHGNWPNQRSYEWRKVLYMTFFQRPKDPLAQKMYQKLFEAQLTDETQAAMTDLGRKVFAIEDYEK